MDHMRGNMRWNRLIYKEQDQLIDYLRRQRLGLLSNLEHVHCEMLRMKAWDMIDDVERQSGMMKARRGEFVFINGYCGS